MSPRKRLYFNVGRWSCFNFSTPTTTTVLWPIFQDHLGEPVPEDNFWTLWCKGRLTEADTRTIRLGTTPSGLASAHLHHPPIFTGWRLCTESVSGSVLIRCRAALYAATADLEYVVNQIDTGYPVDVICLDFQKEFDKVPHLGYCKSYGRME